MKLGKKINIRNQFIGESTLYFLVWVLVFIAPFMNAGLMSEEIADPRVSLLALLKILPFMFLFLLNHLVLFRYLHQGRLRWIYYLVATALVVFIFLMIEIYEQQNSSKPDFIALAVFPWWGNIIAGALMLGANNAITALYRNMRRDEDEERLQRQNIQAEMYYLKHQINPHFLMNTLNNIHALVDIDTDAAKQAVIQLSDMMRYVVYDTGGNAISLKEEVQFIENYIELMRIRYTDDVKIPYNRPELYNRRVEIPPLIFIVFVENAFKHGVSYDSDSYIYIDIKSEDGYVVGRFENSVNPTKRNSKPGIGLENVHKRLDLIYGDRYDLQIEERENNYCITLNIPQLNSYEMHRN
ncbi:MAG: histidine kinase [Alistipes sp.]|nr:histidine kinase [Alistipes sp.]